MIVLIIGLIAVSGGVFVALENASLSRRQIQTNLQRAASYATVEADDQELSKSLRERLLAPAFARFGHLAVRMSPAGKRAELARKIRAAGVNVKPQAPTVHVRVLHSSSMPAQSFATRHSTHWPAASQSWPMPSLHTVPAATFSVPQVLSTHVRVTHSSAGSGQSCGTVHVPPPVLLELLVLLALEVVVPPGSGPHPAELATSPSIRARPTVRNVSHG